MVFHMDDQRQASGKRKRRAFTSEFKTEAVRLVLEEGRTIASVARDLDVMASSLSQWVERARADEGTSERGTLTTDERAELQRLRSNRPAIDPCNGPAG